MIDDKRKYISFSPYFSGLANIIMSYEMFLAIAHITGRTVILPPDCWMLFICESQNKKDWVDFWQIFDKDVLLQNFDCVEHRQVPEFRGKHQLMQSRNSYTGKIEKIKLDLNNFRFEPTDPTEVNGHEVLVNKNDGSEDLKNFALSRKIIELDCNEKFLHFENNLFGHYWYSVYPGDADQRNEMKDRVNRVFKYHDRYYQYSDFVRQEIGPYNAIHVRRNDFLDSRPNEIECFDGPEKLLKVVEDTPFYDPSLPIYIATDEVSTGFFRNLRKNREIYFFRDFKFDYGENFEPTELDIAVLDQVICAQSENFFGTYFSTFTKRINVMRGLDGRQADDWMGINHMPEEPDEDISSAIPWSGMPENEWHWNQSSHYQWMKEIDGELVNEYE